MTGKNFKLFYMLILTMFLSPTISFASSFGLYAEFGNGSGELEADVIGDYDFDIDTGLAGFGFQMETDPVNKNRVFSYRCQAGLESREFEDKDGVTFELGGILLNNTFALGGNVSEKIRLWVGPQFLIGLYAGETDEEYQGDDLSFVGALFGVGIAGGVNIALGDNSPIITTTVGFRSYGVAGVNEWEDEDEDMTGNGSEVYVSVGIMF